MAVFLESLNGGRQIVLDKAVMLIGRQSDCDVVLDNSRKVSRKHCALAQVNDRYVVRDLASMNGVTVNGERVKREAPLCVGDEIAFGDVRFRLCDTNQVPKNQQNEAEPLVPPAAPSPEPAVPPRPQNISQKFPVPIAEEGVDFAVEPSIQADRSPMAPFIDDADHAEPEGEEKPASQVPEILDDDPDSAADVPAARGDDEVIRIEESDEIPNLGSPSSGS